MKKRPHFSGIVSLAFSALFGMMLAGPPAIAGQSPHDPCSIEVPKPAPTNLSALAEITADQAMAAVLAAYPGSRVQRVELKNENACLVYCVSLSNGQEMKVDAGTGTVLSQEQEDFDNEDQEEPQS